MKKLREQMILEGKLLKGRELDRLKQFLTGMELKYEEGIEYSVCIFQDEGEIVAAGSVEQNVIKCVAVHPDYQGCGLAAEIISHLVQYEFEKGRTHIFIYTKPENEEMFSDMGFYTILCTKDILFMENQKHGFQKFIRKLKLETPTDILAEECTAGSIVANCNPFTLGHRYLIEKALEECDYVHLFILSGSRGKFSEESRFEMVKKGICGIERVILHKTSDYMLSAATFPTYFFKDKLQGAQANCMLDLKIFCEKIAPKLHITKRFVGTEPFCSVTALYNSEMKRILPAYDIEVKEIERIVLCENPISASAVRKFIRNKEFAQVRKMVPESVYEYLRNHV